MAAKTPLLGIVLLLAANLLIPLAIGIFGKGFFPYKPLLPGLAEYEDHGFGPPAPAPFDRVVFMVVDALRSDFVYAANSGFAFTQSLIRSGAAVPCTAHANAPTVTMPRIKAITTGSTPSFLDVVLNVDEGDTSSSLASQDTWLAQMRRKDGQLALYGDDTWLKLFPDTFDRADGTSSFFVADFTEVDTNVTRHVPGELRRADWSLLVLHYLGLDHIGHKGGPRSPNMLPKQREMDAVVRTIFEAMEREPHLASTLLVVLGDHGMNDAGNHGASSPGETSAALLFAAPGLRAITADTPLPSPLQPRDDFQFYRTVEQADLAPTLAALLGFPVPKNNLGAFIPAFLPLWPARRHQVQILMHNAHQIRHVLEAAFGDVFDVDCTSVDGDIGELACAWHDLAARAPRLATDADEDRLDRDAYAAWVTQTCQWLRRAQQTMSGRASNYDVPKLGLGLGVAGSALALAVGASCLFLSNNAGLVPFALINVAYAVMMFASSYVEEEHHFWYWATSAWLASIGWRSLRPAGVRPVVTLVLAVAAVRLLRAWNQTGQKFAGEPDLVKTFLQPNPRLLWTLVTATYVWIGRDLTRRFAAVYPRAVVAPAVAVLVVSAFSFKLAFTDQDSPELVGSVRAVVAWVHTGSATLVVRARFVFAGLAVATAAAVVRRPRGVLLPLFTLLAVTQSRTLNIPLFLVFGLLHHCLENLQLSTVDRATAALLLQYASFFAFGGTNAISSVDLSSAYNGISGFSAAAVGLLLFVSNWAGAIYWALAMRPTNGGGPLHAALLTVFAAASAVAVMAACTALRTHLFVWTVFSPKYLYCIAWTLGMHLGVNLGVGALLNWWGA